VARWGKSVFAQFDANQDGKLSKDELTTALKSLPRKKPKTMPPGAKFMSVDGAAPASEASRDPDPRSGSVSLVAPPRFRLQTALEPRSSRALLYSRLYVIYGDYYRDL
jgi:hypothetical protein